MDQEGITGGGKGGGDKPGLNGFASAYDICLQTQLLCRI